MGVVNFLEVVEVEQKTGKVRLIAAGEEEVAPQDEVEVAMVEKTGESVADGTLLEGSVEGLEVVGVLNQFRLGFTSLQHFFLNLLVGGPVAFDRLGQAGNILDGEKGVTALPGTLTAYFICRVTRIDPGFLRPDPGRR